MTNSQFTQELLWIGIQIIGAGLTGYLLRKPLFKLQTKLYKVRQEKKKQKLLKHSIQTTNTKQESSR